MKHFLLMMTGLLIGIASLQAKTKNKVIDCPPFCVSNTTSIEVSRIELSDTATVLHIDAQYRPHYWIKIAQNSYLKDNNGETYPLRAGIGITPDKEFWMPDSGKATFQLVFPPLSASATSIDFTEGEEVEEGFCIWGIQLKSKKLPPLELPAQIAGRDKPTPPAELTAPELRYGKAKLNVQLLDYRPNMNLNGYLWIADVAHRNNLDPIELSFDSQGTSQTNADLVRTPPCQTVSNGQTTHGPLQAAQTTTLYPNLRELSRRNSRLHQNDKPSNPLLYAEGPLAALTEEMNTPEAIQIKKEISAPIEASDYGTYKQIVLQRNSEQQKNIGHLRLSQAARQLLAIDNRLSTIEKLDYALVFFYNQACQAGTVTKENGRVFLDSLELSRPADYVDNDMLTVLNDPKAMLSPLYTIAFTYDLPNAKNTSLNTGSGQSCRLDALLLLTLLSRLENYTPLDEEMKAQASTLPAAYQELLEARNKRLLAQIEANKKAGGYRINQVEADVANEELFSSILAKHRGKVVLVDFWATWCGPCRMANRDMKPMKEELKGKDIVYLYITGENSPAGTWNNMIPNIPGEHYRLTDEQWAYLSQTLDIKGVPTYYIIDRQGNTRFHQTGFPGVPKMKEELLKAFQ